MQRKKREMRNTGIGRGEDNKNFGSTSSISSCGVNTRGNRVGDEESEGDMP